MSRGIKICLPMRGTQVQPLVWKIPNNPEQLISRAWSPCSHGKRNTSREACALHRGSPRSPQHRGACASNRTRTAKANTKLKGPLGEFVTAESPQGPLDPSPAQKLRSHGCQPACLLLSLEQERVSVTLPRRETPAVVGWRPGTLSSRTKRSPNYQGKHPIHINPGIGSKISGQIGSKVYSG